MSDKNASMLSQTKKLLKDAHDHNNGVEWVKMCDLLLISVT